MLFSLPFHNSSKDLRTTVKYQDVLPIGSGSHIEEEVRRKVSKAFVGQKVIHFIAKRSKSYYEQITISILP